MTFTQADVLEGRAQRFESCRFDVYQHRRLMGALQTDRNAPPRITNDTGRALRRQLDGLSVVARPAWDADVTHVYAGEFDPVSTEVQAVWRIQDGAAIVDYPLGVFLFADSSTRLRTRGSDVATTMVDRSMLLDQSIDQSIGFDIGHSVSYAMHVVAELAGIPADRRRIEGGSAAIFGAPVAWPPGRDTYLSVLESLARTGGYLPPYFDNEGVLVLRAATNVANTEPAFRYGADTVVIDGSILQTADRLAAPNRYVAIGGSPDGPIVGIYDVPDAAPNSYANTGIRRRRTEDVQGLSDQIQADIAAYCMFVGDQSSYSWLSFDTPMDPRHDTFDVVSFEGDHYLQTAWSVTCQAGAAQQHTTRGTYGA